MSCIRFNTETMRNQFAFADCEVEPVSGFTSPTFSESKKFRLHSMVTSDNPKIRESVALMRGLTNADFKLLARDEEATVRRCVARNSDAPPSVLKSLMLDADEAVRGFVVTNKATHWYVALGLLFDPSEKIRSLARWRLSPHPTR